MTAPRSTYRLQLRPEFGFDDAAAVASYLAELGVSHVYASPYLQAAPGSAHGYDVVDHTRVNRELGGSEGHERFCAALRDAGLGQVLDIVPNHMAITPENAWWTDVLENGPSSRYASYFDVDWDPPESKLRNRVLLPVLGGHYGRVLEAGELVVERRAGSFVLRYYDHVFPVAPRTYDAVLGVVEDDDVLFLSRAAAALPHAWQTDRASVEARHHDKEVLKRQLGRLCVERPEIAADVDDAVAALNADADRLDSLLERQNYRLAYWRTAGEELDYRRFFDITTLAGLRMEDDQVFADTHALVLGWLRSGVLDGVRVDHPDGLCNPQAYVERLRASAPDAWIVLEKILEYGEALPDGWPVDGTTGYDAASRVTALFVDGGGEDDLTAAYAAYTGLELPVAEVIHESKHLVVEHVLAADVHRLTNLFVQVCEAQRCYRDFTRAELRAVLAETLVCFPVYRTYVVPGQPVRDADDRVIAEALDEARRRRGDLDPDLFGLLGRVLRGEHGDELCQRFQQTSGPVMAKGLEDTAFYRYNRLLCLNEVGADPSRFGIEVDTFHRETATAAEAWPRSMVASSTHDTKRSEDVRARLAVLSEIPREFADAVERWTKRHDPPDANLAWAVFQTLVGAHPLPVDRMWPFVEKAMREAKARTSWIDQDERYESAVRRFVEDVYADDELQRDLDAFVGGIVDHGWVNALSMQLLKLTMPGVPDIYQGTELWDLSLVDPDNRRPVDFELRRRMLRQLASMSPADAWARRAEGWPKLLVTRDALRARPSGRYRPLRVDGPAARHVVAYTRDERVSVVVPRLPVRLERSGGWLGTTVDVPGRGAVLVEELLADFPVALVVS